MILSRMHISGIIINMITVITLTIITIVILIIIISMIPLTDEIRLEIFGSPDYPDFLDSLLSDGDSVYSSETFFEILGTPEKTYLICMGTPVKSCWKIWQS